MTAEDPTPEDDAAQDQAPAADAPAETPHGDAPDGAGTETRLVEAALALAAERPWAQIGLSDIAHRAGVGLAELRRTAVTKAHVLAAYQRRVDAAALEGADPEDGETPRDRLFDLLMRRFDVLNLHRGGAVALAKAAQRDPCLAAFGAMGLTRAMAWMADAAGLRVDGLRGRAAVRALTAVYALTIRDWIADDSPDMAQVMAGLDSRLRRLERAPGGLLAAR